MSWLVFSRQQTFLEWSLSSGGWGQKCHCAAGLLWVSTFSPFLSHSWVVEVEGGRSPFSFGLVLGSQLISLGTVYVGASV